MYVKDVPNSQLRHIRLENNDNKPVTNSRDTQAREHQKRFAVFKTFSLFKNVLQFSEKRFGLLQEVPNDQGRNVMQIIHGYLHQTSIFDDFRYYEQRQEEEAEKKTSRCVTRFSRIFIESVNKTC